MNTAESITDPATPPDLPAGANSSSRGGSHAVSASQQLWGLLFRICSRVLRGEPRPPSVLRNHTNLPVFLVVALGLSLLCNFALKESSAQASRTLGPAATLREAQELVARHPEEAALHSRLGELYLMQRNYKRALFHFREASRLGELYGE